MGSPKHPVIMEPCNGTESDVKNMQILANYLNEIDDLETRLQLATEVQVFDVGIECLKLLRDRERLSIYINQIPSKRHPHFRPKIETLLRNSVSVHIVSLCSYSCHRVNLCIYIYCIFLCSKSDGNKNTLFTGFLFCLMQSYGISYCY